VSRRPAAPAAAFGAGLAGSVAVALRAGVSARDVMVILGLTAAGGLAVTAAGLAVEVWLRRRRFAVSRLSLLTTVVTAAAVLVALAAVAVSMLVNQHDLAIVLAALPVAVGTGALYGILSGRRVAADLEALAALARQLDAPRRPWARVDGPAEVQTVAGLAIARGLVEAHGGWIEVANAGGGCQFTVQIPRRPAGDPAAHTEGGNSVGH
jgi:hypothetical protein